jgi:hypothetical protein
MPLVLLSKTLLLLLLLLLLMLLLQGYSSRHRLRHPAT